MKETAKGIGSIIGITLLSLLVIGIFMVGITALNGTLLPWWYSIQRQTVEQSKSFTNSNNLALQNYIHEYSVLETEIVKAQGHPDVISAYKEQQLAIINLMCMEVSTMHRNTVDPNTLTWLNSHGGCH